MNSEFTNAAIEITIRVPPPITTPFFTIDFTEKLPYYYITLAIMILSFYAVHTYQSLVTGCYCDLSETMKTHDDT